MLSEEEEGEEEEEEEGKAVRSEKRLRAYRPKAAAAILTQGTPFFFLGAWPRACAV